MSNESFFYTFPPYVLRLSHTIQDGPKIMEFLQQDAQVAAMIDAADKGLPSVVGISQSLLERFGEQVRENACKQFVGRVVRPIMEGNGFSKGEKKIRFSNDPVFVSGSRYRRGQAEAAPGQRAAMATAAPGEGNSANGDLVERIIAMFTKAELQRVVAAANTKLATLE